MLFPRPNFIVPMVGQMVQPLMMTKVSSTNMFTGQSGVAVTLHLDFYLGGVGFDSLLRHRHSWLIFPSFSSVPPAKFLESTSIGPRPVASKSFPVHHSSIIASLDAKQSRQRRKLKHKSDGEITRNSGKH
jgi:hypothetical protein